MIIIGSENNFAPDIGKPLRDILVTQFNYAYNVFKGTSGIHL